MQKLLDRFLAYVRHDTRPDESSAISPSSISQMLFAEKLVSELEGIGLSEVSLDGNGYVMATLPANTRSARPVIGFIAHMDTSPEAPSENINPQVHYDYNGGDITLNEEKGIVLSPRNFSELRRYRGETIITSDGTTLLGADDKAGLSEIVTAMDYLITHPEMKHGR
ncbi:MAG: peptidase T, partial [Bacteroidales bacterium]|nr:peptidase T [Bacteroidales bacterium]